MKATLYGQLASAVIILALIPAPAQTDDRSFCDSGNSGAWRLGERHRDGYAIYRGGYRVLGSSIAVAEGWMLGSKREGGGFAIYRWNGRDWDQPPGGAVEIGGSYRRPWVINNRGQRFTWNIYDWNRDFAGAGIGFGVNNRGVDRGFRQDRHNPFRGRDFKRRLPDRNFQDRNRGNPGGSFDRRQRDRIDRRQRGDYRGRYRRNW
jgi:hypothetical protein